MKVDHMILGPMETNCYLVGSERGSCAVVDPADNAEAVWAQIEKRGWSLKLILVTHAHFDHVGALEELRRRSGAPVVLGEGDRLMAVDPSVMANDVAGWEIKLIPFTPDRLVKDGEEITLDELTFRVIATPGHTEGGVCFACGQVLFSGDTLFAGSVGRTDFYGGDPRKLLASVDRLAALPGDYKVCPGHGPLTTMEEERAGNPYVGMSKR